MDVVPIPLSASALVDQELDRRRRLRRRGNILTGCRDVDEYVLLGGFERGAVVGMSVEEDEVGLLVSLFCSLPPCEEEDLFVNLTSVRLDYKRLPVCWFQRCWRMMEAIIPRQWSSPCCL